MGVIVRLQELWPQANLMWIFLETRVINGAITYYSSIYVLLLEIRNGLDKGVLYTVKVVLIWNIHNIIAIKIDYNCTETNTSFVKFKSTTISEAWSNPVMKVDSEQTQ